MDELQIMAYEVHAQILNFAKAAQENLYQMAMGFKKMRDEKLYLQLGYENFGDYCETETGMKRTSVYNYITIVERLPKEFVQSTEQIGKQKLYLLSTISDEDRKEITKNVDLESTTVKDLKAEIDKLKTKNKELEATADDITKSSFQKISELSEEIYNLTMANEALEARPRDVYCDTGEVDKRVSEAVKRLEKQYSETARDKNAEFQEELSRKNDRIWELENRLDELQAKAPTEKKYIVVLTETEVQKFGIKNAVEVK